MPAMPLPPAMQRTCFPTARSKTARPSGPNSDRRVVHARRSEEPFADAAARLSVLARNVRRRARVSKLAIE